jgi:hypothetical protein
MSGRFRGSIGAVVVVALLMAFGAADARGADVAAAGPLAAMTAFYDALEAGDAAAVRDSFHTTTDAERDLADAFAAQLTAARALGEAAKAKFAATGDALSKGLPTRDEKAKLASAEVSVNGDTAMIKLAGQARPLHVLRSAGGRWQLSIADYAGATPDNVAGQVAVLRDMATAFNTVAADIAADKYPNAPEAQRALQSKLQSVMFNTLRKHPPTTLPGGAATTGPTTRAKP